MTFDTLLKSISEKHHGVHKQIIPELTDAVWADQKILKDVVDRYIRQMVMAVCHEDASANRRDAKQAARTGVKRMKPRFGEGRDERIERTERARQAWLGALKYHRLFGGLYLKNATVADVKDSVSARERQLEHHIAGVQDVINLEKAFIELAREKRVIQISDVLIPENEIKLKRLSNMKEAA